MKIQKYITNPLFVALAGNTAMVFARMFYAHNLYYGFLLWNLFLAGVPLLISQAIYKRERVARIMLYPAIILWVLFLPNAPYIITDLVHLYHRPPVPFWFDMLLVLLSAINGLVLGFVSIHQIEHIFKRRNANRLLVPFRVVMMLAMSYGVYLGRYLRFNSWDAIINPMDVLKGIVESTDKGTLGFVLTFSFVSFVLYSFYKTILTHRSPEAP